jgi:hypothetical protein
LWALERREPGSKELEEEKLGQLDGGNNGRQRPELVVHAGGSAKWFLALQVF